MTRYAPVTDGVEEVMAGSIVTGRLGAVTVPDWWKLHRNAVDRCPAIWQVVPTP